MKNELDELAQVSQSGWWGGVLVPNFYHGSSKELTSNFIYILFYCYDSHRLHIASGVSRSCVEGESLPRVLRPSKYTPRHNLPLSPSVVFRLQPAQVTHRILHNRHPQAHPERLRVSYTLTSPDIGDSWAGGRGRDPGPAVLASALPDPLVGPTDSTMVMVCGTDQVIG